MKRRRPITFASIDRTASLVLVAMFVVLLFKGVYSGKPVLAGIHAALVATYIVSALRPLSGEDRRRWPWSLRSSEGTGVDLIGPERGVHWSWNGTYGVAEEVPTPGRMSYPEEKQQFDLSARLRLLVLAVASQLLLEEGLGLPTAAAWAATLVPVVVYVAWSMLFDRRRRPPRVLYQQFPVPTRSPLCVQFEVPEGGTTFSRLGASVVCGEATWNDLPDFISRARFERRLSEELTTETGAPRAGDIVELEFDVPDVMPSTKRIGTKNRVLWVVRVWGDTRDGYFDRSYLIPVYDVET